MLDVALLFFAVVSVRLVVVDLRHHRLPHTLVLPGLVLALTLLSFAALAGGEAERLPRVWGGAASAFLLCLVLHLVRPEAFGGGDATLAALVGVHLGWYGTDAVVSGLMAGFLCGGAVGAGAVLAGAPRAEFAFGPPLLLGTWWTLLGEMV